MIAGLHVMWVQEEVRNANMSSFKLVLIVMLSGMDERYFRVGE